jgi:hypothetical protein
MSYFQFLKKLEEKVHAKELEQTNLQEIAYACHVVLHVHVYVCLSTLLHSLLVAMLTVRAIQIHMATLVCFCKCSRNFNFENF